MGKGQNLDMAIAWLLPIAYGTPRVCVGGSGLISLTVWGSGLGARVLGWGLWREAARAALVSGCADTETRRAMRHYAFNKMLGIPGRR